DDRYSTPTVMFFVAQGEGQAREIAAGDLRANPHHVKFEVRDREDCFLFVADRSAARPSRSI
ncbi:MAG: hypothetical protein JSS35_03810, partial [Proteobacteria bacterium]|nr:hypothetical protein [Pseudomonadota bacterium]